MIRSLARDNRGQELVEYALTLPILLLLVLGIMEFGVAIFAYNTVANAAREGARVGAVLDGEFDEVMRDQIEDAVIARTGGLILTDNNIAITETVVYSPETSIRVTVNYTHTLITGLIMRAAGGDAQLQLRSEASMRREAPLRAGG